VQRYGALASARLASRRDVGLPEQGFVFCSFNGSFKITPRVFDVWMRLLQKTEGSVLWLRESNGSSMRNLRREAEKRGVAGDRLVFAPVWPHAEHLARHRSADLFLDTLPYGAHTGASDALWAGLPVLTCLGESFAGRVAASLLHAVGLPDMVTHSLEEYEHARFSLPTIRLCSTRLRKGSRAIVRPTRSSIPRDSRVTSNPRTGKWSSATAPARGPSHLRST
jgi:predicted O-linked N-acetylglucosamine transferase (SPINDLY family)